LESPPAAQVGTPDWHDASASNYLAYGVVGIRICGMA
jgi:hypothetical protein